MIYYKEYNFNQIENKIGGLFKSKYKCVVNNILTFDTETTTMYYINNKWSGFDYSLPPKYYTENNIQSNSFVYLWMFGFEDIVYYGRRIEDFKTFILRLKNDIVDYYNEKDLELYIYIHNLPYDIIFLFNVFDFVDSFQRKPHKPMYMKTDSNITFKDSYIYSNLSLASISKNNTMYKKLSGEEFDYTKTRFPWSKLSEYEMRYGENDILALWEYLTRERKQYLSRITTMPLTNTGKVRRSLQKEIKDKIPQQIYKCQKLVPSVERYKDLQQLFMGGVAHSNCLYNGVIVDNVKSKDYTSSYPFVLLTEKYPTTTFMKWTGNIDKIIKSDVFVWYATLDIYDFKCKNAFPYLPSYKSMASEKLNVDNGRVYSGKHFRMLVTNVDYEIIVNNYDYDKEKTTLTNVYFAQADYLTDIEKDFILGLYVDKTRYKDDEDNSDLYMNAKNQFNALYGMQVLQLVSPEVIFVNENKSFDVLKDEFTDEKRQEQLNKQRRDKKLVTSFARGVWVTSYARYNLYLCLNNLPTQSVLYTDTDSVKYIEDYDGQFDAIFDEINAFNYAKLEKSLNDEQLQKVAPCDIHGTSHLIGLLDTERGYDRFITYGAKKYAVEQDGKIKITVAGLNKEKGAKKLKSLEDFKLDTVWNYHESGRTVAYYNDNQKTIHIDGHTIDYKYGVVLQPTTYTLSLAKNYSDFLKDCKDYVEVSETCVFRYE